MKACHWTKKAHVQNAVSGIIGCIFTPSLLQKESLWLRYTPICVTQQIRRSSTTVSSTWHPLPKTHTHTQRSCFSLCLQKTCHLAYWFILCCNMSAETGEHRAAPLLTSHARFFLIKNLPKWHPSLIICIKFPSGTLVRALFCYPNLFFSYCISVCSFDLCVTLCNISQRAAQRRLHTLQLEH